MRRRCIRRTTTCLAILLAIMACDVHAATWSDFAIGWRTGSDYREPFNPEAIGKNIFSFTYAGGHRYGSQFFNLDLLKSDRHDPASLDGRSGALEAYAIYRYTLDFGKLRQRMLSFGPVRSVGLTAGFDWNSKNDIAYNSRKRMWVLGPTLIWNVPGHLNTSLLLAGESNAPSGPYPPVSNVRGRYTYKTHPMLAIDWGIPLGERLSFEGFANFIAAKGRNETGQATGPETNIDMRLMLDAGAMLGARPRVFTVGIEYQFWNNKFGNTAATTQGNGYRASTPMLRVESHF